MVRHAVFVQSFHIPDAVDELAHGVHSHIFYEYVLYRFFFFAFQFVDGVGRAAMDVPDVDVLDAGADGIILKSGELLTKNDVRLVMDGRRLVFNQPLLEKMVERFREAVQQDYRRQDAFIDYDIDEYDERFLRHLALGYTKEMISGLRGMPFGVKSLEKRQNDLIARLFQNGERSGVNATRLVVRALQLGILDLNRLEADDE